MSTSLSHDVGTSPDDPSGAAAAVTDIFSLLTHLSLPATTDSDSYNTTKLSELSGLIQAIGLRRSVTRCSPETVARSLGCASECFGDDLPTVNVLVTISQQRKQARDDFAHSVFMNHLRSFEDVVHRMHEVPEHTPTEASKGEATGTTLQAQLVQIGVTGVNLLHDVRLVDGSPAALHILWAKVSRQARALASTSLVALATVVLRTGLRLAAPKQACHLRLWLDLGALRSASTRPLLKALDCAAALSLIEVSAVVSEGSLEVIRIRNERNNVMSLTQLGIGKLPKAGPWAQKSGEVVVDTPFQGQRAKEGVQEVLTQPLHTTKPSPTDDEMEPFQHSTRDNALAVGGASVSTELLTPSSNRMETSQPTPGDQLAQATASLSLHHRFQVLTPELLRELPIATNLDETGGYSSDELVEHLTAKAVEETGEPPLAEMLFGAVHAAPTLTSPAASVGHSVRSYSLPYHMSCLLIEVGGPYCRSGMALRALLVQWWALSEEPWLLEQERVGNTHVLPPPHRRHVVLVADSYHSLQGALLSWTEEAHAEHALLLPLTGVCVADLDRSTYHVAIPLQSTPRAEKFSMMLHHLGRTLAVDPARSFGLCWSEDMNAGLAELGLPPAHVVSSIADCQATLSTWQGATSIFSSTTVPDICARRVALEAHLGSWCGLIRELVARPRRPAVAFQLVSTATKKRHRQRDVALLRSVAAGEALCYGVAMPAVTSSMSCASVLPRARRYRAAQSPVLAMPTPEVRAGLYRFFEQFFTPPVFAAAVDVVRACQEGTFFSHYGCAAQGYLRHDVSCAVGNYIQVRLTVDLQPLISRVLQGRGADWQQVLPHMSCSCTPRSYERVPRTDAGVKKCRHLAEVLYLFMLRQLRFPEEATENRQPSSSAPSTPPPPSLVIRQRKGQGETATPGPVAAAGTDRQPLLGCALMCAQENTTEAPQQTAPVKSPKVTSEKFSEERHTSLETEHYHRHRSRRKCRRYSYDGNRASCRRLSEDGGSHREWRHHSHHRASKGMEKDSGRETHRRERTERYHLKKAERRVRRKAEATRGSISDPTNAGLQPV